MDKYTGKKLDGRYEIQELIGVGGMATVYKAYDTIDDRVVAIKILKDEFAGNDEFIRRFKNESKAIAVLSHPNIVKVFDVSFGDIIQYIVMEYIDGITLKEYIEQQKDINWKEAVYFTVQILQAMQHAHDKGIIHRDVKPQNIMLLQDGTIKVTDFGIARFSNTETRTMTDKAIGSVHYIAPEQARGDHTDAKSDVYSIGVMLYEMLTGKLPFEADNAVSVAIMQLQSNPKLLRSINPDIPEGLEEITLKAMRKEPTMRYQSAKEMLKDIELFRQNPSIRFEYEYLSEEDSAKYENAIKEHKGNISGDYDDTYTEYMEEAEKKRSPAVNVIIGVVISFALVAIFFVVLALFQSCEGATSNAVDIPNFVGMKFSDIEKDSKYKFKWDVINSYNPDKEEGIVLKQEPAPSSKKIREGSVVTLTVNSKNTLVAVPYVNGEPEETAVAKIKAKNLTPEVIYINDESTPETIVKDTSPKAGSEVSVSETVKIFVKKKIVDTSVEVPDLTGMNKDEAAAVIAELGLEFDYSYNEEVDKEKESVIGQSPMNGCVLQQGDTVKAYVAKGLDKVKILRITTLLPESITKDVYVRITVDGVLNEKASGVVSLPATTEITHEAEGSTTASVLVEIDGVPYKQYDIDYETEHVSVKVYPYAPATEPNTEPPTEAPTEPTTDYDWGDIPTDPYHQ